MINACSALNKTTKNNNRFLHTIKSEHTTHKTVFTLKDKWQMKAREREREWLGQLGILEGHSCVLRLFVGTIFSTAHLIWRNRGDKNRKRLQVHLGAVSVKALQNRHTGKDDGWPLSSRATSTDCETSHVHHRHNMWSCFIHDDDEDPSQQL